LQLARQRGETINATILAKLLSRPVQMRPLQEPDPAYILMTGTAEPRDWDEALDLVAQTILLREPGQPVDDADRTRLDRAQLQWMEPREEPFLMVRQADWFWRSSQEIGLSLGVDVYNASDTTPDRNSLTWSAAPPGWTVPPQPRQVPALAVYQIRRFEMSARIDPNLTLPTGAAAEDLTARVTFVQGETLKQTPLRFALPAVPINRLPGGYRLDGDLSDWTVTDRIHRGGLVEMFDRPDVQQHRLQRDSADTDLYAGWTEDALYLAFRLEGISGDLGRRQDGVGTSGNFVRRDFGRPWGEDAAELIAQAVYADGTAGPALHLTVKPNGAVVGARRPPDEATWSAFEGAARYRATLQDADPTDVWRGELAIDWSALLEVGRFDNVGRPERPVMVRFNFAQHRPLSGTGTTWAGPIDRLDDLRVSGVLVPTVAE
jgi:hypothetical protein